MSRKRTKYSTELKTKLVLELLQGDKTLNEIANANNITPKNLQNWKVIFLDNAEMAMEPSKVVKEYKDEIKDLEEKVDTYAKVVGQLTVERDWATKKLKSSDLSDKKSMIDSEHKVLSIAKQCELLTLNRSSLYYTPVINTKKQELLSKIDEVFTDLPIYGGLKVHQQLLEEGIDVSLNYTTPKKSNNILRIFISNMIRYEQYGEYKNMSRKRTTYSTELKTKLVLELLKEEKTLVEIAKENSITPNNLKNWKKLFLENAEMAMEPSKVVKEYKDETKKLQEKVDEYAKTVGQLTVENNWMRGKLQNSDLSSKKAMIDFELKSFSVVRQCQLLHISRSSLYYTAIISDNKSAIKEEIKSIFEEIPIYGAKKVHCQLLENGYSVSLNTVQTYRKELGLRAILAVRDPYSLTKANPAHPKYPYKLKGIDISYANQVWSTDITYIKINGGMVYLAAIIDWYSKAVLSWRISNVMDTDLVMGVLNEALLKYGKPEIFNTDQGSQYTSHIHTQTLKDNGIIISMDGKGRATDNIAIERFWRSAKVERIYLNQYNTIKELKEDMIDYMDFYNYRRFHETLKYKKPMNVYFESLQTNDENYVKKENSVS